MDSSGPNVPQEKGDQGANAGTPGDQKSEVTKFDRVKDWVVGFAELFGIPAGASLYVWHNRTEHSTAIVTGIAFVVFTHGLCRVLNWKRKWGITVITAFICLIGCIAWIINLPAEEASPAKLESLAITVATETHDSEAREHLDTLPVSDRLNISDTNCFLIERHETFNRYWMRLNRVPVRSTLRLPRGRRYLEVGSSNNIVWVALHVTNGPLLHEMIKSLTIEYVPKQETNLLDMALVNGSVRLEPSK
jgi:hypothetical protein